MAAAETLALIGGGAAAIYFGGQAVQAAQRKEACMQLGKKPTAQDIADRILPESVIRKTKGFDRRAKDQIILAAQLGFVPPFDHPLIQQNCGNVGTKSVKAAALGQKFSGLAPSVAAGLTTNLATVALVSSIALVAAPVLGIFGAIWARHKAKAQAETKAVCELVPEVNALIEGALSQYENGQVSKIEVIEFMQKLSAQAYQGLKPVMKVSDSACNLACGFHRMIEAATQRQIVELQWEGCE